MTNKTRKPSFSIHQYDADGDIWESGIWLCFGQTMIKVADDLDDWKAFKAHLNSMTQEIEEILTDE